MKSLLFLGFVAFTVVGCNGSGGGGSSSPLKIEKSITDSTLLSFEQTSGVAKVSPSVLEMIIAKAYAATGSISCFSGQDVSFDMDIKLGASTKNIQVNAKCGDDVELRVRQGMLAALDGHILVREKSQSPIGIYDSNYYGIDFSGAEGFQFGVPYTVLDKASWTRHSDGGLIKTNGFFPSHCFVDYTFNFDTGTVSNNAKSTTYPSRALDKNINTNTSFSIANPNLPSPSNSYEGCNSAGMDFGSSDFRFRNGKIEIDESGTKRFAPNGCAKWDDVTGKVIDYKENAELTDLRPTHGYEAYMYNQYRCPDPDYDSTFERFCIDDDGNGQCDSI